MTYRNEKKSPLASLKAVAVLTTAALLLASCGGKAKEVRFERFERLLFATAPEALADSLSAAAPRYDTPLLNLMPGNADYMAQLRDFVADPYMRGLYRLTDSIYSDLGWLERDLGRALARLPELDYRRFYTMVTGDADDYDNRVFCDRRTLVVSLDRYADPRALPQYMQRLCTRDELPVDCLTAMVRTYVALPEGELTLLDYMVAEGRTLYAVRQGMPKVADTLLLRYTGDQLRWMRHNEERVWSWILQSRLLYSTDVGQFHNLIDEAPQTNAFGQGSAPRTTAWLGLQIVDRYMDRTHTSLAELLAETDSRKILTQSAWRP